MKLKKFFMLFTALTLTNLLQATYACTTINPGNLSAFKIAPRNSYQIIDSKITSSDKRKAPKKITPDNLSAFKIAPRNSYQIIDSKIMPSNKRKAPKKLAIFKPPSSLLQTTCACTTMDPSNLSECKIAPKDNYEVIDYEKYKVKLKGEEISLNNIMEPSKSKFGRYQYRCKCLICGWTGYPDHYHNTMLRCTGCSKYCRKYYLENNILRENMIFCPENELPGLKLNGPYNLEHIHNGFIYDSRFKNGSLCYIRWEKLKKTNEKVWFYCYSCKDYFLVHINDIQHPKNVFLDNNLSDN